ncbi:carbohydrate kinase family protein [Lederbergia galactosidilytica]|uniref:Sugar kinase n=1 Tax=Lederbergia galactosidilytica TaxID=217031 RepID=A0A177ZGM3_9BACI|nr:carbohydrate kinase [Lederbergia galactosidilytica]KRG15396.1 sugar kinase [Virgibacillus soli]OAK67147.1 sugar kinase [Lederbergia galactosidilytica]
MKDVTALGEILIDFTPNGISEQGNPILVANPGGAPANVLVSLSKLGMKTEFIGCVGKDHFGDFLVSTLQSKGVHTDGIGYSNVHTTLAFVHIDEHGDRSFSFYRQPGADMMLKKEDVDLQLISQSRIFHVGSISMTNDPVRETTLTALKHAKEHNVIVSFDPNLRPPLWQNLEEAKKQINTILTYADVVKVSEEELAFLTGSEDITIGAELLYDQYNLSILFITLGGKGSYAYSYNGLVFVPGFLVKAIDTTGCGDAFLAGVLYQLMENEGIYGSLPEKAIKEILKFGNAMGAYVAMRKGGIPSMPTLEQLQEFMVSGITVVK